MQKFSDYQYERIDFTQVIEKADHIIGKIEAADSFRQQYDEILSFNQLLNDVQSMAVIASVRHSIDTTDAFYEEEQTYYDHNLPDFEDCTIRYFKALIGSRFQNEMTEKWGSYILIKAKTAVASFSSEIIEDMKLENSLTSEYQKLLAVSLVEFRGEKHNLSSLMKFFQHDDRTIRKGAFEALADFFRDKEEDFDVLFDKLVKVRTKIAKTMDHDNYVSLGYLKMQRTDYGKEDVEIFRKQAEEYLVPICTKIRESQAKRIGAEKLKFYDQNYLFPDGNAVPKGDAAYLLSCAKEMYSDMSGETNEFFNFMSDSELLDLKTKKGKAMGGYCTYIPDHKAPFIFSNFNGTSADADVLTHEAGHAFQAYCCRDFELMHYTEPTFEACEIHSMSMEYFAYPYMELFFGGDKQKYLYTHLAEAITFIPYGVCVDHFQHEIYAHPEMSFAERKALWRNLEKKYLPHIDYDGNDEMEKGVYWYRQLHIFMYPFYYIDYTLASVNAMNFYAKLKNDRQNAWKDYLHLCRLGGSMPYKALLKEGDLLDPFAPDSLRTVIDPLLKELGI